MQQLKPAELKHLLESKSDILMIDTRDPLIFADGFIPGSINISPKDYHSLVPALISKKVEIIIIDDSTNKDQIQSEKFPPAYFADYISWKEEEGLVDMIITIDAYEFGLDLKFDKSIQIIDLRKSEDFEIEHINDVQNINLTDIPYVFDDYELTDQIYFYGYNLEEAMTAASIFKKQGYNFVKPIKEGFEAISKETHIKTIKKKKKS